MPELAVIIPLHNKGKYVGRTLESVFVQTWSDFEVIVVDDGSTDDGPDVVRAHADPRVRLISQENQGPGAARNRGLRSSTAPYLTFLDADDEWSPDFLQTAIQTLKQHEDMPVFVADHFRGTGTETYRKYHPELPVAPGPNRLPVDTTPALVKVWVDMFAQGAAVIAREAMGPLGGYCENGCTYGEDAFLWLRVLLNYPIFICEAPLLRVHLDSSVLGYRRSTPYPVHALVERAHEVLQHCPDDYRDLLDTVLDYYALISLRRCMGYGDFVSARGIMRNFPRSCRYRTSFIKARIELGLRNWAAVRSAP